MGNDCRAGVRAATAGRHAPRHQILERDEFERNDSLRSPTYLYNLLEKLGDKKIARVNLAKRLALDGADITILDEGKFLDFSARTVFGVNPDDLGSPMTAALGSLGLFTAGALVPLVPWFITEGTAATVASLVATAVAGLLVGGWVSGSAGRPVAMGALRQLLIVVAAAAVTYAIGALFGTAVA